MCNIDRNTNRRQPSPTKSVATQCNLLNAPPLEKFPQATASLDDSFATETEPEETDLDTSFCLKQEDYTTE